MYIVAVEFVIHPEHIESFGKEMLLQAANSLAREAACQQFDVNFDPNDPARCFLYEKYDDRAAFDTHLASDHFKHFDAEVSPWIAEKRVQTWQQEN